MKAKAPALKTASPEVARLPENPPRRDEPLADTSHLARTPVVHVATDTTPPEAGRLLHDGDKPRFLAALREAVIAGASAELAGTGWTTEQCPYIEYWFAYYAHRSAGEIEAALRKYAPGASAATTLDGYLDPVVTRVRAAIAHWKVTAEVDAPAVDVPEVRAQLVALGPGEPLDSATRSRFEGAMQVDLSHTRIHRDGRGAAASSAAGARAFAIGDHVAFGAGQYAPGTLHGDALLAHELAHTQQQDATRTASAGNAHETAADQSAKGWLGRLWGFASRIARPATVTAGLQLQRCKQSHAVADLGVEEADSDVGFVSVPEMHKRDGQWFAVVGQTFRFRAQHENPNTVTSISRMFYAKVEDGVAVAMTPTNSREVELDSAGTWVVWAGGHLDGNRNSGYSIRRVITVVDPADYAKEAAQVQVGSQSVPATTRGVTAYLRMQIALQQRLESQFGATKTQYSLGPYIESDAPNPMDTKDREVVYRVKHIPKGAASYRWERAHADAPIYSDPGNKHLWTDLGTTTVPERTVTSFLYGKGEYLYSCTILDAAGNSLGTAHYRQMVVYQKEMEAANKWVTYLAESKKQYDELKSPMQVPGAFVNGATGEAMPLYMFVGESKAKAGRWVVLDLTPDASKGGGPKVHAYSGASIASALESFKSDAAKRYPSGRLHLMTSIVPGQSGDMAFSGGEKSWLRSLADWLGLASIGWTVAGFAAAIFGAEPLAMVFFGLAAGTGALSSAASLADRINAGEADAMGVFIDIAGFAVSVIGLGQASAGYKAARAAAQGGAVTEVAVSAAGRRFVQWTEQKLVQSTAILISVESIAALDEVVNDQSLSDEEKAARIAGLLRQIVLQVGILSVSRIAKVPPALEARANQLATAERQALNALDDAALEQLAKMPDDVKPVIALALDHPVEVNAALKSGKVSTVAELEAAVQPTPKPAVEAPPATDIVSPATDVVAPHATDVVPPPATDVVPPPATDVVAPAATDVVAPPATGVVPPPSTTVVPAPKQVKVPATKKPTAKKPTAKKPRAKKPKDRGAPSPKKPDDPRSAAEAELDPVQVARYQKKKNRGYKTFAEWWEAKGKTWYPNKYGAKGAPDHQQTIDRLVLLAEAEFPGDIIHRETESIVGMRTPNGKVIRNVERNPDVWVEDAANRRTVKKVYEAGRTNEDGSFVSREMKKKKQYDGLGLDSHFEPVRPDPAPMDPTRAPSDIDPED